MFFAAALRSRVHVSGRQVSADAEDCSGARDPPGHQPPRLRPSIRKHSKSATPFRRETDSDAVRCFSRSGLDRPRPGPAAGRRWVRTGPAPTFSLMASGSRNRTDKRSDHQFRHSLPLSNLKLKCNYSSHHRVIRKNIQILLVEFLSRLYDLIWSQAGLYQEIALKYLESTGVAPPK